MKKLISVALIAILIVVLSVLIPVSSFKPRCLISENVKSRYSITFGEKQTYDELKFKSENTENSIDNDDVSINDGACPAEASSSQPTIIRLYIL